MDVGYIKIKIDIKTEYDEYRKKFEYRRKERKREEIKKIFEGFREFFRQDSNFKFKENEHSLSAEYKDHAVTLDYDLYNTLDSPSFDIAATLKTWEKDCFEIVATAHWDQELPLMPPTEDKEEQMAHDTRFFKDFLDGKLTFTYLYSITGRDGKHTSVQEVLRAV